MLNTINPEAEEDEVDDELFSIEETIATTMTMIENAKRQTNCPNSRSIVESTHYIVDGQRQKLLGMAKTTAQDQAISLQEGAAERTCITKDEKVWQDMMTTKKDAAASKTATFAEMWVQKLRQADEDHRLLKEAIGLDTDRFMEEQREILQTCGGDL